MTNKPGRLIVVSTDVSRWQSYDEAEGLLGDICPSAPIHSMGVVITVTDRTERLSITNNTDVIVRYLRYTYLMQEDGCFWVCGDD